MLVKKGSEEEVQRGVFVGKCGVLFLSCEGESMKKLCWRGEGRMEEWVVECGKMCHVICEPHYM